jgi:hypothetical protein
LSELHAAVSLNELKIKSPPCVLNVLLIIPYFITKLGKSHAVFVVDSYGVSVQGVGSVFVAFVLDTEVLALVFLLAFDFPVSFCTPVLHIHLLSGVTALRPI